MEAYEHCRDRYERMTSKAVRYRFHHASKMLCDRVHFEVQDLQLAEENGWPVSIDPRRLIEQAERVAENMLCYVSGEDPTESVVWRALAEKFTTREIASIAFRVSDSREAELLEMVYPG